jgi:hypothetical protein
MYNPMLMNTLEKLRSTDPTRSPWIKTTTNSEKVQQTCNLSYTER